MEFNNQLPLLQAVLDALPQGTAILEPVKAANGAIVDFTILLLNAKTLQWVGDVDYKGRSYADTFPMVRQNGLLQQLIDAADRGQGGPFEIYYEGEGMQHWFRITAIMQADWLVVTTEVISEARKTEMALRAVLDNAERQRRLYDSITNNTPDLVYVFDLDYKFTYANKALLTMWGKSAEAAIGKGLRDNGYEEWHALMHEREIDAIIANKRSIRGTVSFPHAELGRRVYDYIFVPVLDGRGNVEAIAGTTRDITDIKDAEAKMHESEARLKSMIDQTPVSTLVLLGDDLVIEQINKPMLQFIGFGEEAIGQPLLQLLPELEGQDIWRHVRSVYEKGIDFDQSEVLVRHKRTGVMKDYYYNLAYRPLRENGQITGMIQVAVDVTEQVGTRKKLEESEHHYKLLSETLEQQVSERTRELQRSNEDLQQFAHVASHDLKEPLRKITMFANRLQDRLEGQLDESAQLYFDKIHSASERMATMIEGVLNYSTVNASKQQPEMVDLNGVLEHITSDLEVALQRSSGTICHGGLPTVEGAPVLLYQLFYNLVNNSIKFAQAGRPPQIEITAEPMEQDGKPFSRICIRDNGIGFDPEKADKIFDTFTRLNSKDQYEGTGLGLSLCKKIVERHGGRISATATPKQGARFFVVLPLRQDDASA